MQQLTLASKVSCFGIGLHTGAPVQITLKPARAGSGVVFVRREGSSEVEIPARAATVSSTSHATTLTNAGVSVSTVEHLMAALYATGIDNLRIEVDGPEVPVMDGSARPFVELIHQAGTFSQPEPRAVLRVEQAIEVNDGERRIRIDPSSHFQISYAIDFEHPAIRRQSFRLAKVGPAEFAEQLAPARTFGFLDEVSTLLKMGLARGGSLENTVVLDAERVVNDDGLRWPDEFVRHKMLDLIGDLALIGPAIRGHVTVERGGHALHHDLVQKILHTPDAWRLEGGAEDALLRGLDLTRADHATP